KFVAAFVALSMLLFINAANYAQVLPSKAERKGLMKAFNQSHGNLWSIVWNDATGTPESILGYKISSYTGTPAEIAMAFLRDKKGMLGIADVDRDLHLDRTSYSTKGGTRFVFSQKYNGIPILASGYLVAVGNDGGIYYISGSYFPEVNLNTSPSLSVSEATSIIQSDLTGSAIEKITTPKLFIQAEVDNTVESYTLVYQAEATISLPHDVWRYIIDANTGAILNKTSMIEKIDGNGDVYQTHPFSGGVVNRILHRLRDLSPRRLDGDNVVVVNDSTTEAEAPSGAATFVYPTTHTHFDEVMAYYHGDEFEAWLINKGMETGRVGRVTIHTEDPDPFRYAATN
ncbi:MAG: PepSY domain-containing protein, partial [bacterium]